jgi:hypothetical protein
MKDFAISILDYQLAEGFGYSNKSHEAHNFEPASIVVFRLFSFDIKRGSEIQVR